MQRGRLVGGDEVGVGHVPLVDYELDHEVRNRIEYVPLMFIEKKDFMLTDSFI